jgi:excisionase family DNA binding protein
MGGEEKKGEATMNTWTDTIEEDMGTPELLTVQEVAGTLRVDATTVRRWIKNGALEAVSLPHRHHRQAYRIKKATLERMLNGGASALRA